MSLLELSDVKKRWGSIEALRGVTFNVDAGEVIGLVGDNGAGKSTLMKTITGVQQPTEGTIRFDGTVLNGKEPGEIRSLGVEMIYQDLALAKMQDVATNIFLGREPTKRVLGTPIRMIDRPRAEREAEAMIRKLGARIPSVQSTVGKLSGGQQQSVAIARALTFNPKLVIMDEPTAALAVREVEHVLELIRELRNRGDRRHPHQPPAQRRLRRLRSRGGAPPGARDRRRADPDDQHERRRRPHRRRGVAYGPDGPAGVAGPPEAQSQKHPKGARMPQQLRVGVVGCGEVTQIIHLPTLHELRDFFTVDRALRCQPIGSAAVGAGCRGARLYADYRELVADPAIDAVLVCNPDAYHAEVVIAAIRAGKHVLLEKPICLNLGEADAMIAAEAEVGRHGSGRLHAPLCTGLCRGGRGGGEGPKRHRARPRSRRDRPQRDDHRQHVEHLIAPATSPPN